MEDKQEYGMVWQARHGKARLGGARQGKAWHCMAGRAGRGVARHDSAWQAWQGRAWRGAAVHGRLGVAGLARLGIVLNI